MNRFIFISKNVRDRTARLGELTAKDVVIYNGVKVGVLVLPRVRSDHFVQPFDWSGDAIIVGMTGQMTRTKGHEDFLKAARLAISHNDRLRFVIGGKPAEPYRSELLALIAESRLDRFVVFSGWMSEVRDFYQGIDIFVLPSRHDEGFGLVVAEAMERGCSVIATRSGGAIEIIEDGVNGYCIDKKSPEQLATKILTLSYDSNLRACFAAAARQRVEKEFDQETQAEAFECLLKTVTSKKVQLETHQR